MYKVSNAGQEETARRILLTGLLFPRCFRQAYMVSGIFRSIENNCELRFPWSIFNLTENKEKYFTIVLQLVF